MRKSIFGMNGLESLLVGAFIVCVFYGDVHLRLVFPLSMALLPALLAFTIARRRRAWGGFNTGVALLLGLLLVVGLQFFVGSSAPKRPDVSLYGPVVYAIATAFTLSLVRISDSTLWKSLIAGGLVTAAVMMGTMAYLPDGEYLIPGQDFVATGIADKKAKQAAGVIKATAQSDAEGADGEKSHSFYLTKSKVRNALGRSNYVAVFFVFLFTVALYRRNWIAVSAFGLLTVATLSRFGMLWMAAAALIWLIHYLKIPARKVIAPALALLACVAVGVFLSFEQLQNLPVLQSVGVRLSFWQSGFNVVADHLLLGAPRSAILDQYGYLITWNPHNSVLWVASIFGLLGLAFYAAYVFITMRGIYQRAVESRLWLGIFVGLAIVLTWSFVEIIVHTPAFEILLALLYGLSRSSASTSKADAELAQPAANTALPSSMG